MAAVKNHPAAAIAEWAIDRLDRTQDPRQVHRQIVRSMATAGLSLLALAGTVGVIAWGPNLEGEAARFAVFLLFVEATLFVVGLLAALIPASSVYVNAHLDALRNEADRMESEEELAEKEQQVETLTRNNVTLIRIIKDVRVRSPQAAELTEPWMHEISSIEAHLMR